MHVAAIHHVQLAMPEGGEEAARGFYDGLLGISEVPKPTPLAARGGCWFESGNLRVHLGIEEEFRPARKAHPALVVVGLSELVDHLRRHLVPVRIDDDLHGFDRAYVDDPFGNRIELLEAR